MLTQSTSIVVRMAVAVGSLILSGECLHAGEPAEEGRWFAQFGVSSPVDWEAEGSRRLITHNDGAGNNLDTIRFGEPDGIVYFPSDFQILDGEGSIILDLAGTVWIRRAVIHVTESGSEEVRQVYWLSEEGGAGQPSLGLTSKTGPDGDVFNCATVMLTRLGDDSLRVSSSGSLPFHLSLGLFQR